MSDVTEALEEITALVTMCETLRETLHNNTDDDRAGLPGTLTIDDATLPQLLEIVCAKIVELRKLENAIDGLEENHDLDGENRLEIVEAGSKKIAENDEIADFWEGLCEGIQTNDPATWLHDTLFRARLVGTNADAAEIGRVLGDLEL
jgi:hypothetical protein